MTIMTTTMKTGIKMKKNKTKIKINVKPIWQIGKGHNDHISGSGEHDNRPKRNRTRKSIENNIMRDYYNDR